jgi:hypothetical protein
MLNEAVIRVENDPLKSVADALDAAALTASGGVDNLRSTASGVLPTLMSTLSAITYKTGYAVSYGTVFSTVFLFRTFPRENAVAQGFVDGARAAIGKVKGVNSESQSGDHLTSSLPDHGTSTT